MREREESRLMHTRCHSHWGSGEMCHEMKKSFDMLCISEAVRAEAEGGVETKAVVLTGCRGTVLLIMESRS